MRTYGPRNRGEEMSAIAFGLALCSIPVSFVICFAVLGFWGPGSKHFFDRSRQLEFLDFGASFLLSILVSVLTYRVSRKLLLKPHER
jgi:hypothetical protein